MAEVSETYPGGLGTAAETLRLAGEYRKAAQHLMALGKRGDPMSRAPCRLAAIHAIELYLNALLLHLGHKSSSIRGLQHDLAKRTELAIAGNLKLRQRTTAHLSAMTGSREYLVTRYGTEMMATVSQINRLMATLEELAGKIGAMIATPR